MQVVALVRGTKLLVANAGDSRCVMSRGGTAVAMTHDHKPTDTEEHDRIIKAGPSPHAPLWRDMGLSTKHAWQLRSLSWNQLLDRHPSLHIVSQQSI